MDKAICKNEQDQLLALVKSIQANVRARCYAADLNEEDTKQAVRTVKEYLALLVELA